MRITKENYNHYKAVYYSIMKFYSAMLPEDFNAFDIIAQTLETIEKENISQARKSLQIGFNDLTHTLQDFPVDKINKLNQVLEKKGYPNCNQLLASIKNTAKKIIKQGKIKNQEEYFLLKEIENDLDSELNLVERKVIQKLLVAFECSERDN